MKTTSRLTSKAIESLKPRDRRYTVSDGFGLTLRVQPSGTKTWVLRLSVNGRLSDITLGRWPEITLLQARQMARRRRKDSGLEPPRGYVLRDAFKLWCGLKKGRIVSYQAEKRRLEKYVMRTIGNRQIDEISAPLIIQTVRCIEDDGHQATLKRVLMRVREIMDLAVCAGYIRHNPIDRVSKVFAPAVVTPMPSIDWQELPDVMRVFVDAPRRTQLLFLWATASMLRPSETVKIRTDWIEDDVLTIPGEEMKKRKPHRVPLTDFMQRILFAARAESTHPRSPFIWCGRSAGAPMSSQTITKYLHASPMSGRLVGHGLRSIARSWLADHGAPFEAAEACLAHVTGSKVSRSYQRSDYLDARRDLMARWSEYVEACASSAGLKLP